MGLFDDINKEAELKEKELAEVVNELPIAYQIRRTSKPTGTGAVHEEIIDTYHVDRKKGIDPKSKAYMKAKALGNCFVVAIKHEILFTFK